MCSGDDNPPEFYVETRPRARKPHRCVECGRRVPPGEVYVKTAGKWDGGFDVFVQHVACRELLQFVSDEFCGGESWSFGTLRDELGEYGPDLYGETDPDLHKLAVEAHARFAVIKERYVA